MLDLRLIRRDPEQVKQALARRDPALAGAVDEILGLDQQWRSATSSAEELRAKHKEAAEQVAAAKRDGQDASELLQSSKQMSAQVKALVEQAEVARAKLDDSL